MIVTGVACLGGFVLIYFKPDNRGYTWLFVLLSISIGYKLLRALHEWYHYWKVIPAIAPTPTRTWTVDVLTTFCPGEPHEMIVKTLETIQAIRYPHTTYLCDEANDPYLRQVCERLGVRHVTRTVKKDAKAGNINNALQQATGEICLVLDPDHIPAPNFLDQVLPYFEDPQIGFVQCVQAYYNRKESLVAYGAAQQTYSFYGPMMICMSNYGTAQAIGANCTFRRAALDSIGGHAAGLSEAMHTAMQLHAQGWESVYVPQPLSYGLVPSTLSAYYKQQLKWARGTFELLLVTYPRLFSRMTWRQRVHYFTLPFHYLSGLIQLIDLLIPICSLILLKLPLRLDLDVFALAYIPLLFLIFLTRQYAQRWLIESHEVGFHIVGGLLSSGTWWVYFLGFVYAVFRVEVPYLPTPKNDRPRNNFLLCLPNAVLTLASVGAIAYCLFYYGLLSVGNKYVVLMIGFALINALVTGVNVLIGQEKLLATLRLYLRNSRFRRSVIGLKGMNVWRFRYDIYGSTRAATTPVFIGLILVAVTLAGYTLHESFHEKPGDVRYATTQPFYYGTGSASFPTNRKTAGQPAIRIQHLSWSPTQNGLKISPGLDPKTNGIPLLYLEPDLAVAPTDSSIRAFLDKLLRGQYNPLLNRLTGKIRRYNRPVVVSFAPYFDDTARVWGTRKTELLLKYRQAFRYLARYGQQKKATNLVWMWCPAHPYTIFSYYPGHSSVDWIGLEIVNDPATANDGESHSFSALYQPHRHTLTREATNELHQKPVFITKMQTRLTDEQVRWQTRAMEHIRERYPEIRGLLRE
ncbi:glycosyltransferase [Larkinella terrae]|uniref:glycosyltransferase n=1 Tax=Larkinella terrae TaxID=2025311 RepID=UPI001E4A8BA4|nr:glycosyltransferase [Larkinella terrae]